MRGGAGQGGAERCGEEGVAGAYRAGQGMERWGVAERERLGFGTIWDAQEDGPGEVGRECGGRTKAVVALQ